MSDLTSAPSATAQADAPTGTNTKEATSKNGNKYQVQVHPDSVANTEATSTSSSSSEANAKKAGFAVDVNWPPSEDWVYLDQDLADKIHITRYKIVHHDYDPDQGGIYFEWTIWFTNTANYDFFFEDKTHDEYENNCFFKRDHATAYNSSDPTIIRVRGV